MYVNNKVFKGATSGSPEKLMLDATPLAASTNVGLQVEGGQVTLNGEALPTEMQGEALMIDARDLAQRLGGRYSVNKDLQSVDIYLLGAKPAADTGGPVLDVSCYDLCRTPELFAGKMVRVRGPIVNATLRTDEQIKAGDAGCSIREVRRENGGPSYFIVNVYTNKRVTGYKDGTPITVTGVFRNDKNRPGVRATSVTP